MVGGWFATPKSSLLCSWQLIDLITKSSSSSSNRRDGRELDQIFSCIFMSSSFIWHNRKKGKSFFFFSLLIVAEGDGGRQMKAFRDIETWQGDGRDYWPNKFNFMGRSPSCPQSFQWGELLLKISHGLPHWIYFKLYRVFVTPRERWQKPDRAIDWNRR